MEIKTKLNILSLLKRISHKLVSVLQINLFKNCLRLDNFTPSVFNKMTKIPQHKFK